MTDSVGSIRACGYRVVVEPENNEKTSRGGIIIPEKERAEQEVGKLVAAGPLAWTDQGDGTPWAEVGDRVLYSKYGGKMVHDPGSGVRYRVLNDEDIVAVIHSEGDVSNENYWGDSKGVANG